MTDDRLTPIHKNPIQEPVKEFMTKGAPLIDELLIVEARLRRLGLLCIGVRRSSVDLVIQVFLPSSVRTAIVS